MADFKLLTLLLLLLTLAGATSVHPTSPCRCLAFQNCWPSESIWNTFNSTIRGRLIRVLPPAAPCYSAHFDAQACHSVRRSWKNMFWRTAQPGAFQDNSWEPNGNQQCLIDPSPHANAVCSQGLVPTLAVDAREASDVQSAVTLASQHNLRIVIKNTGHDYVGRTRAAGSFGIWTHNLRGMTFHEEFTPEGCKNEAGGHANGVRAVTVGAGVQWEELYLEVYKRKAVIVGGGCSSVGAGGGYPLGGGHSPLSPTHGLASDNVLQLRVVTADGRLLVANSCQNKDLFWALRGGGGATFGVVVSITHKLHPAFTNVVASGYRFTANNRSTFEKLVTKLVELNPGLSDAGWGGYGLVTPLGLTVGYLLFDRNVSYGEKTLRPLVRYAKEEPGIQVQGALSELRSFQDWHLQAQCSGMANCYNISDSFDMDVPIAIASRLIPRETFERHATQLSEALVSVALDFKVSSIILNLVAGGRVAVRQENAVNPAWRKALWHVVLSNSIRENSTLSEHMFAGKHISDATTLLRRITPGSGAYMNEGDFNEPDWQRSLFGENYPRLSTIKEKYDPNGLFVCHHCVGSENWSNHLNCRRTHG